MELIDQKKDESYFFNRLNKATGVLERVDMITGEVTPISGTNGNSLQHVHQYTLEKSGAICELIREGHTINKIAMMEGFPPAATIYNWKRLFPDFAEKLEAAFIDRTFHFQDKIIDDLGEMESLGKDEVPAKKLQVDTAFKLMEKGNPEQFGNKVKLSGDKNAPLQFVIDTGIRKPGDEGFDENEFNSIDANFSKIDASGDIVNVEATE